MTERNQEARPGGDASERETEERLEERGRVERETREAGQRAQGGGEPDEHDIETSASRTP